MLVYKWLRNVYDMNLSLLDFDSKANSKGVGDVMVAFRANSCIVAFEVDIVFRYLANLSNDSLLDRLNGFNDVLEIRINKYQPRSTFQVW
jgi:hypothetical protein